MTGPAALSPVHAAPDGLRRQLCHCGLKDECLGCKGVEMVRSQVEAVAAAASQPVLMQVAQEAAMKDMASQFEGMAERLLSDPELRRAAEALQGRGMSGPGGPRPLQGAEPQVDRGASLSAIRRLPSAIIEARRVVLGQSARGFRNALGADVYGWERVKAPARRRSWYYDGSSTLAVLLASPSDIDDLLPTLVGFQIEWNKLHRALRNAGLDSEQARVAAEAGEDDWGRLREAWGERFQANLAAVREAECNILLRMIGG